MFVCDYRLVSKASGDFHTEYSLPEWTKNFQSPYMRIFTIHMICDDDDLQNVCGHSLPERQNQPRMSKRHDLRRENTYKPSPSSFGSAETSKVYHPSGFSKVTIRMSCKSIRDVPALTARVAGVYESSRVKLNCTLSFCVVTVRCFKVKRRISHT